MRILGHLVLNATATMAHSLNWFEIPVADMSRAIHFYETVTGWTLKREAFGGPGGELAVFPSDLDGDVRGALCASASMQPADMGTLVYLNAGRSLAAWMTRVDAAGGRIVLPEVRLPAGMGAFAHIIDSEGNRVGLHAFS